MGFEPIIPTPNANAPVQSAPATRSFKYEAQAMDGKRITGTVDADSPEWVSRQLELLRLRLIRLEPVGNAVGGQNGDSIRGAADTVEPRRRNGRALRGDDFIAFNQQLAHLAKAGLPIESGLRLIAKDMRSGRLASTVKAVADELDRGMPIGEAFEKHRGRFPSLYGRLLDAGVRSGDLAGVLLGFGAHLEMLRRLRAMLWRTLSYPLAVLAALSVVLLFLGHYVLPRFQDLYAGFANTPIYDYRSGSSHPAIPPDLPLATQVLFGASCFVPYAAGIFLAGVLLGPIIWQLLRLRGGDRHVLDAVALRLPLIGRPLRLNLIARWCDALRIGVTAGLPLPEAIELTGDAVRSPRLRRDGRTLIERLSKGQSLSAPGAGAAPLSLLPATVPVAIELASGHNDLPATLRSLTELYERQAELRMNGVPAVLTPVMVIVLATTIGFVILALLLPLMKILEELTRAY